MGCTVARDQPAGSAPYIGHTPLEERVVMTVSQKVNFYFSDPNPDLDPRNRIAIGIRTANS